MSGTDRDLVAALRAELAAIEPGRPCDRSAQLAGLGPVLHARDASVARMAVRLGGRAAPPGGNDAPSDDHASVRGGGVSAPGGHATTSGGPAATPGGPAAARRGRRGTRRTFVLVADELDWGRAPEHCRLAWLRGRFLARGSLSLASGRAHLEFVVPLAEAPGLAARLADVELPAAWRVRRGLGVVTWKSAESITSFLGRLGATTSLLELEARSVARSLRGDLNRVLNAESANLQRSVEAAGRQVAAIDELEADGRLAVQPYTVRAVAEARRQTPEASLSEIAVRLDLHRSAVQRALDRLERLSLHDDGEIGRRRGRGPYGAGGGEPSGHGGPGRGPARQGPMARGGITPPLA